MQENLAGAWSPSEIADALRRNKETFHHTALQLCQCITHASDCKDRLADHLWNLSQEFICLKWIRLKNYHKTAFLTGAIVRVILEATEDTEEETAQELIQRTSFLFASLLDRCVLLQKKRDKDHVRLHGISVQDWPLSHVGSLTRGPTAAARLGNGYVPG